MMDNKIESEAKLETLWSVLSRYDIVIPRMQRDYAQGRKTQDAKRIRTEFIKEIFDALIKFAANDNTTPLDLNFIYGNVENDIFYPIDGQQRLTTLYLLYWYLASYQSKGIIETRIKDSLKRFKYQSRDISGTFCEHLINDVAIDVSSVDDIVSEIKDYYWFYGDYETDPTVCSMLVMLRMIDETAKACASNTNVDCFITLLLNDAEKCPIRFLFQNLNDVGMTDSIYIKMNARGKPLTPFENFKAQLLTYLRKENEEEFADDFIDLINGEWSNLFWKCSNELVNGKSEKSAEKMDECMMRFFRFMMQIDFIVNSTDAIGDAMSGSKDRNVRETNDILENEDTYTFVEHLFADGFSTVGNFKSDNPVVTSSLFKRIKILLKTINKRNNDKEPISFSFINNQEFGKQYLNETDVFLKLIGASEEKKFTNTDKIKIAAEFAFIVKYADGSTYDFDKHAELNRWMRYIHNLAINTESSSREHYCYCIKNVYKKLDELDEKASNILESIFTDSVISADNSGFQREQAKEEKIKAKLLLDDYNLWAGLIAETEDTKLDGEIQCLLSFSEQGDGKYSSERFALYNKKMQLLFGKKYDQEITANVLRALLSVDLSRNKIKDDEIFLFTKRANFNFWTNQIDGIGNEWDFRRFLRNDNKDKRLTLQYLLDNISDTLTENDISNELERIISANMIQAQNACSGDRYKWLKILVDDPDILESFNPDAGWGNDVVFKNASRYIRVVNLDNSGDDNNRIETIYLLERTVLNSNHREIFTYELYLSAKRAGLNVKYKVESSTDVLNSIEFVDKFNHTIQILYGRYTNGQIAYLAKDVSLAGNDLFAEDIQKSYVGASIDDALVYISGRIKTTDSEDTNN